MLPTREETTGLEQKDGLRVIDILRGDFAGKGDASMNVLWGAQLPEHAHRSAFKF